MAEINKADAHDVESERIGKDIEALKREVRKPDHNETAEKEATENGIALNSGKA